jgi:DNA polymerase-1
MKVLIDADILLYQLTASNEVEIRWTEDLHTLHSDPEHIKDEIERRVKAIEDRLEVDYAILVFSGANNFRKTVYPDYKGNRRGQRKPLAYAALKDWCLEAFKSEMWEGLEADDVMGIMATEKPGDYIIWSEDKDLMQIPGLLWRKDELVTISEHQAAEYFFTQVLTGDPTDGYPGCPGIGAVTAQKALSSIRFLDIGNYTEACWKTVVDLYARAGLSEDDALIQARCARILQASDYNFTTKEPILWTVNLKSRVNSKSQEKPTKSASRKAS